MAKPSDGTGGWQPLAGVKVLDFSALLPGPFCTLALADLGADVVKVEPPGGDFAREIPFAMFRMANRNKRSIVLDLKSPSSRPIVERLAAWADISVEGFRPGVAARLGIDHQTLSTINPRLISCSISGYGQSGPERLNPGHDLNYLAAAGALSLAGHWSEPPRRSGLPIADLAAGSYAAIAILAALEERHRTGRGVALDLGMSEAAMSFTAIRHGFDLDRSTRDHLWPTNDLFETADGRQIALGIVEEKFWRGFVAAAQDIAPDLDDAAYGNEPSRRERGDALAPRMRDVMRQRDSETWMRLFAEHDVPAQRVMTPDEAARSEQAVHRQMVMEADGERHIPFPVFANGRRGAALRWTAQEVGEATDEVLSELSFRPGEIASFRSSGALGPASRKREFA
ncbi:CaiB/BaiF CoA transferase family protein [Enterovirga aerilata]|uniref:CoA transferase n=1 Tax=Enterovirga aerilata TaxID=2730920 RepID=A0A849I4S5_9HYPH|nr:CaiB/BaiF CoA-transferase family protein [Enterovirga sp. DB1703]NNM72704.1 CoA transferase [Enterovirga sp. DB1703]